MSDVLLAIFYSIVVMSIIYAIVTYRESLTKTEKRINDGILIKGRKL